MKATSWRVPVVLVVLAGTLSGAYAAQKSSAGGDYPNKPIRFIVPYVAGGAADIFTRTVGQKLTEAWGQTVVVDNRAGANGGIGTELAAKSPPDGYTLLLGNSGPITVNPVLYKKTAYDPVKTPVFSRFSSWRSMSFLAAA